MTSFESRWRSSTPNPDAALYQRIDDQHPLDFYLGVDAAGDWSLLLVSEEKPASFRSVQAIQVTSGKRHDGRWALNFRLTKPDLGRLFALLCEDLVESSRSIPEPSKPASHVLARFARWQRLLERGGSGLLDEAALRGLIGELLFLERLGERSSNFDAAVHCWQGPQGGIRDFVLSDCEFEVKTVRPGARYARISSAEQLDTSDRPVELVILELEGGGQSQASGSFTPVQLVERIRQRVEGEWSVLSAFDAKLLDAGFVQCEEYNAFAFSLVSVRHFCVPNEFPSIRRSRLPAAIGDVTWDIDLTAISGFERKEEVV